MSGVWMPQRVLCRRAAPDAVFGSVSCLSGNACRAYATTAQAEEERRPDLTDMVKPIAIALALWNGPDTIMLSRLWRPWCIGATREP